MPKLIVAALVLGFVLAAIGCGPAPVVQAFDPASIQGKVDTTLSSLQQSQQHGMRLFLNAIQEGAGDQAGLSLLAPVTFRDPFPAFFGTSSRLVRWDFNGPPRGNEVPVTLYFDNHTSGPVDATQEVREDRVYYVVPSGQRYTIARKQ
jgi:hypothetical protein